LCEKAEEAADIHQAARMLFGSQMDGMAEADFEAVVDAHLPECESLFVCARWSTHHELTT
jgi:predicted anti-sigma-YlaC factor YlaD